MSNAFPHDFNFFHTLIVQYYYKVELSLIGKKAMTNLDSILKAETLLCQQRSIWSKLWFFQ